MAAPFRWHHLRADGCAGEQAPPGHGLCPYQAFRPRLSGFDHCAGMGRGQHRNVSHPVRCRFRRSELRHHGQFQLYLATGLGRGFDPRNPCLCGGGSGLDSPAVPSGRGRIAPDHRRIGGAMLGRIHGRLRADAACPPRRAYRSGGVPVVDEPAHRLADLWHPRTRAWIVDHGAACPQAEPAAALRWKFLHLENAGWGRRCRRP